MPETVSFQTREAANEQAEWWKEQGYSTRVVKEGDHYIVKKGASYRTGDVTVSDLPEDFDFATEGLLEADSEDVGEMDDDSPGFTLSKEEVGGGLDVGYDYAKNKMPGESLAEYKKRKWMERQEKRKRFKENLKKKASGAISAGVRQTSKGIEGAAKIQRAGKHAISGLKQSVPSSRGLHPLIEGGESTNVGQRKIQISTEKAQIAEDVTRRRRKIQATPTGLKTNRGNFVVPVSFGRPKIDLDRLKAKRYRNK